MNSLFRALVFSVRHKRKSFVAFLETQIGGKVLTVLTGNGSEHDNNIIFAFLAGMDIGVNLLLRTTQQFGLIG